ncbi:MAG: ASPIC/UnbV domain-containing [Planctomycetota bacterium]|nr:MAG: ASPIC/UnbV domain-containing [Planctomycetota bacterium]
MFVNTDFRASFVDTAYVLGLDLDSDGRASVPVDIDGDGDLDLVALSLQGLHLLENRMPTRRFARIRLTSSRGEPAALGSIVRVETGNVSRQDYVRLTEGFMSQVPGDLHFGLGDAERLDRVVVKWPDGSEQEWKNLPTDRLIELHQGRQEAEVSELMRWSKDSRPRAITNYDPPKEVDLLTGGKTSLSKELPLVLQFWSPSCASCIEDLPVLGTLARKLESRAQFVFLCVDRREIEQALASQRATDGGGIYAIASESTLVSFFGSGGQAAVPSTFVLDNRGRLRRGFLRSAKEEELIAVLDSLDSEPRFARDLALLGRSALTKGNYLEAETWLRESLELDPGQVTERYSLAVALIGQAKHEEALAALQALLKLDPDFSAEAWFNTGACLRTLRRPAEALDAFANALRVRGRDDDVLLVGAAGAAVEAQNLSLALEFAERSVRAAPESPNACLAAAKVRLVRREFREAERYLLRTLTLRHDNVEARELLGALRKAQGK